MIAFIVLKRNFYSILGILGLFTLFVVVLKNDAVTFPYLLKWLPSQALNFSHASLTTTGIILSLILVDDNIVKKPDQRIFWMIIFGVILFIAGYFLRPFYGISKIYATPSWALYSASICCFLFSCIYWLVDIKGVTRWANFLKPAGSNPLLTYILPFLFYAIVGYSWLPDVFNEGGLGILRSVLFSLFILGISAILTKNKIILHL
jgi:predicted acyltransferase